MVNNCRSFSARGKTMAYPVSGFNHKAMRGERKPVKKRDPEWVFFRLSALKRRGCLLKCSALYRQA